MSKRHRKPRGYSEAYTIRVRELAARVGILVPRAYTIYGAAVRAGFCCFRRNIIVVPDWVFRHTGAGNGGKAVTDDGYAIYYIAHEAAHAWAMEPGHGPAFMRQFKRLCPAEYQHYEAGYKPRRAAAAGISKSTTS